METLIKKKNYDIKNTTYIPIVVSETHLKNNRYVDEKNCPMAVAMRDAGYNVKSVGGSFVYVEGKYFKMSNDDDEKLQTMAKDGYKKPESFVIILTELEQEIVDRLNKKNI